MRKQDVLKAQLEEVVKLDKAGGDTKVIAKNLTELNDALSRSLISYVFKVIIFLVFRLILAITFRVKNLIKMYCFSKDEIRKKINELKKEIDMKEKNAQAVHANQVADKAVELIKEINGELFFVEKLDSGANVKVFFSRLFHFGENYK